MVKMAPANPYCGGLGAAGADGAPGAFGATGAPTFAASSLDWSASKSNFFSSSANPHFAHTLAMGLFGAPQLGHIFIEISAGLKHIIHPILFRRLPARPNTWCSAAQCRTAICIVFFTHLRNCGHLASGTGDLQPQPVPRFHASSITPAQCRQARCPYPWWMQLLPSFSHHPRW